MQVVLRKASYARGYSGADHLLADYDFDPLLGRVFASKGAAEAAAEELSTSIAPVRVDVVSVDDVPVDDLEQAALRASRKGWEIVQPAREAKPYVQGGKLWISLQADDGPGIGAGRSVRVAVYSA